MKTTFKIGILLLVAASLFATTSCTEEFQVEESQLYGKWAFPQDLAPDTTTGFNWAEAVMTIKAPDTITVSTEPGKVYKWTLRDNNVTATCTPRANVDEHMVIAFTVYNISASQMEIVGKYRYLYEGENSVRGDISCTLKALP